MGVKGLWNLLEPTGRRVDMTALAGQRVAVDASIWLVQFIKAMRDERGDMIHNAYLIGFFRRICRMLYYGVSPVFVFDGATPTLKRHTAASRRQFHVDKALQMRRTAEKLLLSSVKASLLHDEVVSKSLHDMGQGVRLDRHLKHVLVSQPAVDDDETAQPDGSHRQIPNRAYVKTSKRKSQY
mmetsp:Transcript_13130/g.51388  ORF Transcript_13130/g.51388 Transcript_13130/m.51388 type:complete len:182 (-) Transcript_13130:2880-3425(-)